MGVWRELAFPVDSLRDVALVIDDERASIITDPLRWRILETLGDGKSVADISVALNITDARILYHCKRLAETGVVRLEEGGADPRLYLCRPLARRIRVRETASPWNDVSEAIPPDVSSDFNQASLEAAEGLFGAKPVIARMHNRSRLSEEQALEFTHRLVGLIEEYFPPGMGDRSGIKYGFYGTIMPIDLHPLEDS
jgi:DNA-binding transcriptional ArsR family regulator